MVLLFFCSGKPSFSTLILHDSSIVESVLSPHDQGMYDLTTLECSKQAVGVKKNNEPNPSSIIQSLIMSFLAEALNHLFL